MEPLSTRERLTLRLLRIISKLWGKEKDFDAACERWRHMTDEQLRAEMAEMRKKLKEL